MNKEERMKNMWTGAKFTLLFMISIILLPFILPMVTVMGIIATKLFVLAFIIWLIIIGFIALGSVINRDSKDDGFRIQEGRATFWSIRDWGAKWLSGIAAKIAPGVPNLKESRGEERKDEE